MADDPSAATPSLRERLGYVALGLAPFAFAGLIAGLLIWPVYFGIALLVLLFMGIMHAAIFVWPYEDDHGW